MLHCCEVCPRPYHRYCTLYELGQMTLFTHKQVMQSVQIRTGSSGNQLSDSPVNYNGAFRSSSFFCSLFCAAPVIQVSHRSKRNLGPAFYPCGVAEGGHRGLTIRFICVVWSGITGVVEPLLWASFCVIKVRAGSVFSALSQTHSEQVLDSVMFLISTHLVCSQVRGAHDDTGGIVWTLYRTVVVKSRSFREMFDDHKKTNISVMLYFVYECYENVRLSLTWT